MDAPLWSFDAIQGSAEMPSKETQELRTQPGVKQKNINAKNRLAFRFDKFLVHPIEIRLIALCPTLDLVAIATGEKQLECFRFDGHRAFWYKKVTAATIEALSWVQTPSSDPTARSSSNVCIAWSDGKLDFLTAGGEKLAETNYYHRISDEEHDAHGKAAHEVTCFATGVNQVNRKLDVRKPWQNHERKSNHKASRLDENRFAQVDEPPSKLSKDSYDALSELPLRLALIDVLEDLPPLSALTLGAEDSLLKEYVLPSTSLCSKIIVDELINKEAPSVSETAISMMLLCSASGYVSCILNNGFSPSRWHVIKPEAMEHSIIHSHATNPSSRCQAFLIKTRNSVSGHEHDASHSIGGLTINLLSLGILRHPASLVPLVLHTSDILLKLTQYIIQTVIDLRQTIKAWQRLPGRFLENISETLSESGSGLDLPAALYRLAVTGNCSALVKDWLVDQIGPMVSYLRLIQNTINR